MAHTAHLLELRGPSGTQWKLLDQTTHAYLLALGTCAPGQPHPPPPAALIADICAYCAQQHAQNPTFKQSPHDILTPSRGSTTLANDCAASIPPSSFNGERFARPNPSFPDLVAFINRHGLTLGLSYEARLL